MGKVENLSNELEDLLKKIPRQGAKSASWLLFAASSKIQAERWAEPNEGNTEIQRIPELLHSKNESISHSQFLDSQIK